MQSDFAQLQEEVAALKAAHGMNSGGVVGSARPKSRHTEGTTV